MSALKWVASFDIPGDLRAAHVEKWPDCNGDSWMIDIYRLPQHPLTDAINDALGVCGAGVACGYARLHTDNAVDWRGLRFVSLVITGQHWIEAQRRPAGNGDAMSVNGVPGTAFVLRPDAWHCAIYMGEPQPLRMAQWEVPTHKVPAAIKALKRLAAR